MLTKVGDAAFVELLLNTELFAPIPGGSFLQLSGRPIAKLLQLHKAAAAAAPTRATPSTATHPRKRPSTPTSASIGEEPIAKRSAQQNSNRKAGADDGAGRGSLGWRTRLIPRRKIFYNYHFSRMVGLPRGPLLSPCRQLL